MREADLVRRALVDPRRLCTALGLLEGYKPERQGAGGLLIRCPVHSDRSPSCSVSLGPDGTLRAKCFACGWSGDVLHLIAAALSLDVRADFPAVLGEAARLAGVDLAEPLVERRPRPEPLYAPLSYPDPGEVAALWRGALAVTDDGEASDYLESRKIDPGMVALYDLARVLPPGCWVPSWARIAGRTWSRSHRLILPMVDHGGVVRTLRAWHLPSDDGNIDKGGDIPKRTTPAGKRATGIVLACSVAQRMLATGEPPSWVPSSAPFQVLVTEGEPDFLLWCSRVSDANDGPRPTLGIINGSWSLALAARLPRGARVLIRTDPDAAGDRYAADIRESLHDRVVAGEITILDRDRGAHDAAA